MTDVGRRNTYGEIWKANHIDTTVAQDTCRCPIFMRAYTSKEKWLFD